MAKEIIFLVEESPEGGYEARALGDSMYFHIDCSTGFYFYFYTVKP